jgi:anti-sigma regulatory factor (Ser/Thr protein kinase)
LTIFACIVDKDGDEMGSVRKRGEQIRHFILSNVSDHPGNIASITAKKFQISRQATNRHFQTLIKQMALVASGSTRNKTYKLHPQLSWDNTYSLDRNLEEDWVWRNHLYPLLGDLPNNVIDIWHYGFTEMFNNVLDHSNGETVYVGLERTAINMEMQIIDRGVGIFRKIQAALELEDERHAVLELSKGKFTTDPENHTGEGIFFSSRMFDKFAILSGGVYFSHEFDKIEDWISEINEPNSGTAVFMRLDNHTSRTLKKVFDQFTDKENFRFSKTIVPVRLVQYGDERLVSRSQAKRLLSRVDRFKVVIFDFENVTAIGQAFADEIFRVFKNRYPEIETHSVNTNKEVEQQIARVGSG